MPTMPLNSIRARMTFAFALSIALVMVCACGVLITYARHVAERNADELLRRVAAKVRRELAEDNYTVMPDLPGEIREAFLSNGVAIVVIGSTGKIINQSQPNVPIWPRHHDDGWRVRAVREGVNTLVFGIPWRRTEHALNSQALTLLLLSLFVVAVASVGAWLLVGRTLSPIDSLVRQADCASVDTLRVTLSAPSQDAEIERLVKTLNQLLT